MAVALAGGALEAAGLETAQTLVPGVGEVGAHSRQSELSRRCMQERERGVNARPPQARGAGFGDAGQVGELQSLEDGLEVGVVDTLQAVSLVEIGRLLRHPDRGRDAHRARDAFADLLAEGLLDGSPDALRPQLDEVRRAGQVHRRLIDRHAKDVGAVALHDVDEPIGGGTVQGRVGLHDKHSREDRLGLIHSHAGLDAQVAGLSRRGDDGGGISGIGGDGEGPAPESRIVLLLDRCEGAVQIDDKGCRLSRINT